jgi:hypothetical protein
MRILSRMDIPSSQRSDQIAEKETIETLRGDKSQATMANFIQKTTQQ